MTGTFVYVGAYKCVYCGQVVGNIVRMVEHYNEWCDIQ
jgi:hypothetical protein